VNHAMNELSRRERGTDVAERKWSRAKSPASSSELTSLLTTRFRARTVCHARYADSRRKDSSWLRLNISRVSRGIACSRVSQRRECARVLITFRDIWSSACQHEGSPVRWLNDENKNARARLREKRRERERKEQKRRRKRGDPSLFTPLCVIARDVAA